MFKPGLVVAFVLLLTLLSGVSHVKAQTSSTEFWPESDNWLKLTKQWRLSMFFSLSKNIETKYREGNYIAQIDYVFGKTHSLHTIRLYDDNRAITLKPFMIRPGYLGGTSIGDNGQNYKERTGFVEFHLRNPLKSNVLVSHRVRNDLRFPGDENPDFSWRIRYRLQIEKEITIKKTSLVPYINVAPYYNSRDEIVNRVCAIGGATAAWQKWYALKLTSLINTIQNLPSITSMHSISFCSCTSKQKKRNMLVESITNKMLSLAHNYLFDQKS